MNSELSRNKIFRTAACEFAEKIHGLTSPVEVAIVGSVAGGDQYPSDVDVTLVVNNLGELPSIAKYARQMSRICNDWEVFLFNENMAPLGRVCHRRECPGQSVDCKVVGCGSPPHLRVHAYFNYDEKIFFSSPIDVLWTSCETSLLLTRREKLGITKLKSYPRLEDIEIVCVDCGKAFLFSGSEQKWYDKRGLTHPKRCFDCINQERKSGLREW